MFRAARLLRASPRPLPVFLPRFSSTARTPPLKELELQLNATLDAQSNPPADPPPPPPAMSLDRMPDPAHYEDKHVAQHRIYIKSTRNNTIITLTSPTGNTIEWTSSGRLKFKGANKASYEAGYACAIRIANFIRQKFNFERDVGIGFHILLSGFGQGRDAMYRALMTDEAKFLRDRVQRITDRTPIKIGGTKPKKTRRL